MRVKLPSGKSVEMNEIEFGGKTFSSVSDHFLSTLEDSHIYDVFICGVADLQEVNVSSLRWMGAGACYTDGSVRLEAEIAEWLLDNADGHGFLKAIILRKGEGKLMLVKDAEISSEGGTVIKGYLQPAFDIEKAKEAFSMTRGKRVCNKTGI
jgi:hypothetical protein